MSNYLTENLRTVALVGHGSCGKTSLIEAMLYRTGRLRKLGRVDHGSAAMDNLNEKGQLICPVWLSGNPTGLPAEPAAYRRTSCRTR